jgi:two-component system response regulator YesN
MQFLALLRVEKAKIVLADRQRNVTDAWHASGFVDLRTFEREFKKWVGCSPKEHRRKVLARLKRSSTQAK